ncbi:hypothetical protein M8C21_010446 [Ambrosia artemisiifolia]|uniref:25S rRNA (uridine-N(3))-methyltransferase BMT5-like domain-containing protein n=1 Tax=Ambrosia artemisiifolia TaxID=4212 RepID=A0AAD5CE74_AMBAR|nr:hypothetical protein M8C21_010446 [Ambrosia artemisiifolia]
MALSQLLRKSLTKSTHCFALLTTVRTTQLLAPKTMGFLRQPVAVVPSRLFGRMYSSNRPAGYLKSPQLLVDEDKKKLENENEEPLETKEPKEDMKKDEEGQRKTEIKDLYNTDQKILIGCVGDFSRAHYIASELGDASKMIVMSQYSCVDELETMYENARSQMLDLTKLGARIVFDVDFKKFAKDSRINHTRYDIILLDLP